MSIVDDRWVPEGIDLTRPSPARIYDYHLGGAHNFEVDRQVAEQLAAQMPDMPLVMRANRTFLTRAVRLLIDAGVRQFLDLGSGIPTVGNVHEIAHQADPAARVAYVDVDPVAVAHSTAILEGNDNAGVVHADLRDVPQVLNAPEVRRLIDFSRPVGVLMVSVLHFVPDSDDPCGIVADYLRVVPSGSFLVLSHGAANEEDLWPAGGEDAAATYARAVADLALRTRAQVSDMFAGLDLLEPGVTYVTDWRPEGEAPTGRLAQLVGVARKP